MRQEQLHQIIKDKNEQLERQALRSAEEIIEQIVREQQKLREATKKIDELRAELKALEIAQLNPSTILGQE